MYSVRSSLYLGVVAIEKEAFGSPSTKVNQLFWKVIGDNDNLIQLTK